MEWNGGMDWSGMWNGGIPVDWPWTLALPGLYQHHRYYRLHRYTYGSTSRNQRNANTDSHRGGSRLMERGGQNELRHYTVSGLVR